ncbi:MAG: hypothetical protein ACTSO2_14055 [Promethearchaeota archaeon]
MPLSPPKKSTVIISLVLIIIGTIISLIGYLDFLPADFINPIQGYTTNQILFFGGFALSAIAWFLFFLGTRLKGI